MDVLMPAFSRRHLLFSLLALGAGASGAKEAPSGGRPLVFGLIAPRNVEQNKENWTPLVQRLGAAVGMPVELRVFAAQGELSAAFRKGEIDLGWMGNAPALEVVESGVGSVFSQGLNDGRPGYVSVLIVHRTSKLQNLADVLQASKELRFGDGDVKSTSGHLVPTYYAFQKKGIENTKAIFKSVSHSSHQKNLQLVAKKEVDVATCNDDEMRFFAKDFPDLHKDVRVIWTSPVIPQSPLLWKNALPADLRRKILNFTNNFGKNEEELRILDRANGITALRQSSNRQLVTVADIEMFKARQAIINDTKLVGEERQKRIDEVIRRSSKLDLLLKISSTTLF
jgi:phosphonate transport system substrate-binding protein